MGESPIPHSSVIKSQPAIVSSLPLVVGQLMAEAVLSQSPPITNVVVVEAPSQPGGPNRDALLFLLPLLIVLSTFLFLVLLFLVFVILLRRRRGIRLRDGEGPVDLSREDHIEGEGGIEGVESRWLESVTESERRTYLRAKGMSISNKPCNVSIGIRLSSYISRLSAPVPAKLPTNRYYPLPISLHSGEGGSRLVFRTRPRGHAFIACPRPNRNHIPTRPLLRFFRPVQSSVTQTERGLLLGGQDVRSSPDDKRRRRACNKALSVFPVAWSLPFLDRLPLQRRQVLQLSVHLYHIQLDPQRRRCPRYRLPPSHWYSVLY